jgi:hypothetical protein
LGLGVGVSGEGVSGVSSTWIGLDGIEKSLSRCHK